METKSSVHSGGWWRPCWAVAMERSRERIRMGMVRMYLIRIHQASKCTSKYSIGIGGKCHKIRN